MKFGLMFPQTEIASDPEVIRDFAQGLEAIGFDYVVIPDQVVGVKVEDRPEWDPLKQMRELAAISVYGSADVPAAEKMKRAPYDHESSFQEPLVLLACPTLRSGQSTRATMTAGL